MSEPKLKLVPAERCGEGFVCHAANNPDAMCYYLTPAGIEACRVKCPRDMVYVVDEERPVKCCQTCKDRYFRFYCGNCDDNFSQYIPKRNEHGK